MNCDFNETITVNTYKDTDAFKYSQKNENLRKMYNKSKINQ